MSRARVLFSTLPIYQIVQLISLFSNSFDTPRQADNYGANGRLPLESPKSALILGKKDLMVSIFGLNFPFKMYF